MVSNLEQRLFGVSDFETVSLEEVLSHVNRFAIVVEHVIDGIHVEHDFFYNVSSLVTPLSNNTLPSEFLENPSLGVLVFSLENLVDPIKARYSRHELVDVVNNQCDSVLVSKSRGFETRPHDQS